MIRAMKQRRFMEAPAQPAVGILNERQYSTLRRLSDLLQDSEPAAHGSLFSELNSRLKDAPVSRKQLYLRGLDTLEFQSQGTFRKPFAETTNIEADSMLLPLRQQWVYITPSTLIDFLRAVKQDVRSVTIGSRMFPLAGESARHRGGLALV